MPDTITIEVHQEPDEYSSMDPEDCVIKTARCLGTTRTWTDGGRHPICTACAEAIPRARYFEMHLDKRIVLHPFAQRQTADSRYSHTDLSEQVLINTVFTHLAEARPSKANPRVFEVPVPPWAFHSSTIKLQEGQKLAGIFEARREGEDPRIVMGVEPEYGDYEAAKQPAVAVSIILFPSKVLAEDGDNTLPPEDGNFEIISINARMCEEDEPIHPNTLMANHFGETGGTATGLTDEEFVRQLRIARDYWRQHARLV